MKGYKNRWGDILKEDSDADGEFLIKLVVHKLYLMSEHFKEVRGKSKNIENTANVDKIIKSINACYELGNKVLTFDYGEAADKVFDEKGSLEWLIETSEDNMDYIEWNRLTEEAENARQKDIEKFFRTIGRHINNWWL